MPNGQEEYIRREAEVVRLLGNLRPSLPADELRHAEHLLSVGELELAFESLGLSVIQARLRRRENERASFLPVGQALGLDRESVYDPDFWQNLVTEMRNQETCSTACPSPDP